MTPLYGHHRLSHIPRHTQTHPLLHISLLDPIQPKCPLGDFIGIVATLEIIMCSACCHDVFVYGTPGGKFKAGGFAEGADQGLYWGIGVEHLLH